MGAATPKAGPPAISAAELLTQVTDVGKVFPLAVATSLAASELMEADLITRVRIGGSQILLLTARGRQLRRQKSAEARAEERNAA